MVTHVAGAFLFIGEEMNNETNLVKLDRIRRELMLCKTIDDAKDIRDKAEAMRNYAKQRDYSLESQNHCAEIKLRAERKIGEFSKELPKANPGVKPKTIKSQDVTQYKTEVLKEAGLNRMQAHRFEAIAELPEETFEKHIQETKDAKEELTTSSVLKVAKDIKNMPD